MYDVTSRSVHESLLPLKSNERFILVCVCMCARVPMRACSVCMCVRACSLTYPACHAHAAYLSSFVASLALPYLLRMRNVLDKSCVENQNAYFMFNKFFPRKLCLLWYNVEIYGGAREGANDDTVCRMHFACCITNAANAHWEYVILTSFSTTTVVTRTLLNVTSCVHYLSCVDYVG